MKKKEMCEVSGFSTLLNGWEYYVLVAVDEVFRC